MLYNQKDNKELLPWIEKYRPVSIKNIIYHEKITKTIVNYFEVNKLPHLLFYGSSGTGKTSSILAISKHYYNEDFENMVLILNASEERGIETVRNRIKQFVTTSGLPENKNTPPFKLIILDEIDAMTEDAQAILRKVIEKYVNNVRFCFICNYLKKINPAIQSRCIIFRFKPIPEHVMLNFTQVICKKKKIIINDNALKLIIKRTNGDMRKLLNILQSIYMYMHSLNFENKKLNNNMIESDLFNITINENHVSKILSCPTEINIIKMLKFIQKNNLDATYDYILDMMNINGISLRELIDCFYEYFMDSIINNNKTIIKYDNIKQVEIIKNMSLINENLSYCNNDNNQIISFISLFYL
jgi:replication factor C subunit 3/5